MTTKDFLIQTGYAFLPPHNPVKYLPTLGTYQEQALGTEKFCKNQALFRRCTAKDGAIKNKTIMVVKQLFL